MEKEKMAAWVEVDLRTIGRNTRSIKRFLGSEVTLLVIVKANAYGHGLVETARVVMKNGAGYLGVARIEEGIGLRKGGVKAPILITTPVPLAVVEEVVKWRLTPTVATFELLRALGKAAGRKGVIHKVHVKVDTGLTRNGVLYSEAADFVTKASLVPNIKIEGVLTHLPRLRMTKNSQRSRERDSGKWLKK